MSYYKHELKLETGETVVVITQVAEVEELIDGLEKSKGWKIISQTEVEDDNN